MAEKSLSEQIGLAVSNKVYEVAAKVNQVVEDALYAIDDVLAEHEKSRHPEIKVDVNLGGRDPHLVGKEVVEAIQSNARSASPSKTGGSGTVQPSLSREQLLREVYRYMRDNTRIYADASAIAGDRVREIEDNNAGVVEGLEWVPGYLVENFARHIKDEFGVDGKHPYLG